MDNRKQAIINALRAFVNQRPGFEPGNYSTAASYRVDQRQAQRQKREALQLLRDIELRNSITADAILKEAQSGRLSIEWTDKGQPCPRKHSAGSRESVRCGLCCATGLCVAGTARVDYCAGQYYCTEFRGAVARLCASVLWTWKREQCMPQVGAAPVGSGKAEAGMYWDGKRAVSAGDWLRDSFRREYGRTLANRYFD